MHRMALIWVVHGMSRYWEIVETANEMSGCIIMARYMRDPIISLYIVFLAAVRRVGETNRESSVKSVPGSMGVMAGCACYNFLSLNNDWIPFTHDSDPIAIDSLPMTHLLQSSVSSTALHCRAQLAYSSFRLFFSRLLRFTDCDTLCLTHYTYPFYYINPRITLYSVALT